jgi:hypothetical protein
MPVLALADDVPPDALPRVVQETIDMKKREGVVKSADSYAWGNTTIFKVEIDLNGVPDLELHIAENGKLIRVNRARAQNDDDESDDDAAH